MPQCDVVFFPLNERFRSLSLTYAYLHIVSVGNLRRLFAPAVKHHGMQSTQYVKNPIQHNLLRKVSFLFEINL